MGGVWNKAPKNSKDILEELDKDIKSLTKRRVRSQQYEKSFIGYLLVLSFLIYLVCAVVFYLYFLPRTWFEAVINSLPLLLFPVVVFLLKRLLNIYFTHLNTQYELQLRTLHEERRKVLNEVMEKETYRTAVELLRQYDPTHPALQTIATPASNTAQTLRQRNPTPHPSTLSTPHPSTHAPQISRPPLQQQRPPPSAPVAATPARPVAREMVVGGAPQHIPPGMCMGPAPGPPTPCPILPRERSAVDKVVEYLVGDGPSNRYALICSQCHSHNGMALRDEFEYMSFRCAYCYHVNTARKSKPTLQPDTIDHMRSGDATAGSTVAGDDATPSDVNTDAHTDQQTEEIQPSTEEN